MTPNMGTIFSKKWYVNEHEGPPNITLRHKLKQREQAVIGNNIDVNEHEGPPNITLRHELKQGNRL